MVSSASTSRSVSGMASSVGSFRRQQIRVTLRKSTTVKKPLGRRHLVVRDPRRRVCVHVCLCSLCGIVRDS